MNSAEEYFNKNYGKGHIEKCIELNDIQSIYSLMEEFKDSEVNKNVVSDFPRELTAENGAKALLIGEFHETIVCHDEYEEPHEVKMPVEWDTIKKIYNKIVSHYSLLYKVEIKYRDMDQLFEMPVDCEHCGEWFDLNDGYPSRKWHPSYVICPNCHNVEVLEIEEDEEEIK